MEPLDDELGPIGGAAETLDREKTATERLRLPVSTVRRIGILSMVYLLGAALLAVTFQRGGSRLTVAPLVVVLAFILESTDSAAGMGFGTGLAPLLFVLGYDPLQVVPVLLLSETMTGILAGLVHHEVRNVTFSLRPLNEETKLLGLLSISGTAALAGSVVLTYLTFAVSDAIIKAYVSVMVLLMGVIGIVRAKTQTQLAYRPRRLVAFALFAGVNKGIGGGGYGPVITLGQILSGVYEKSAVAITSLAEGIVSLFGGLTFVGLLALGTPVDLVLLPSVFTGGFLAAIVAPYLVRVIPNTVWRYVIPLYAIAIGGIGIAFGIGV